MNDITTLPIIFGHFLKRYKRFLADIQLENQQVVTVHCPNSGSLLNLLQEGALVLLRDHGEETSRKLRYTLDWIQQNHTWISINTHHANRVVEQGLQKQAFLELKNWPYFKREVAYGKNSRIDFLLNNDQGEKAYLEVKSINLKRGDFAQFPDCPTERGTKHLLELIQCAKNGFSSYVLYLVQRDDCKAFKVADDLDPLYAKTAILAKNAGVNFLAYSCHLDEKTGLIEVNKSLNIES